ncbi:MAG: S8 family serine peptidase [Anaerolineae bacterium]|nr:S8 family serine peptidase [Anaerolineae bacterium]
MFGKTYFGVLVIAVITITLVAVGCVPPTPVPVTPTEPPMNDDDVNRLLSGREDPYNLVYHVEIADGKDVSFEIGELPEDAFGDEEIEVERKEDAVPEREPDRVHPILQELVFGRGEVFTEPVIVVLQETLTIPRFPSLPVGVSRDSDIGKRALAISEDRIEQLLSKRSADSERFLQIAGEQGVQIELMEQYWLINGFVAKTELDTDALERLLSLEQLSYIQPAFTGEEPPQDGNANNDVDDGRARIVSDPYFNLGLTSGYIGLLDSGIRDSHQLFNSPRQVDFLRDCVNGGANCNNTAAAGYNTTDNWDHGTSSAGILVGNNRLGNAFRGVTDITLDSWKIYTATGLDSAAAVRGIQRAVAVLDRVLVGEIQAIEGENGAIAVASDNAYDAGAVNVAANGNPGPGTGNVRSPGLAHKTIGVGALDVTDLSQYNNQGRGPAPDGRYKPDLQAPNNSETSESGSDTDLGTFGGTSGATPYAAGAAALMRNWLRSHSTYDNGAVYAHMIQSGTQAWPGYSNTTGLGLLQMPVNGQAWWGKVNVGNGGIINIPIGVGPGSSNLRASLWWPEGQAEQHDDIDVHLIDPGGIERAKGYSGVSIFERAQVPGNLASGQWTVRIRGYNVASGPQQVFWVVDVGS